MTGIVYRNDKHEFNLFFQTHNQQKIFFFIYAWGNWLIPYVRGTFDIFCLFFQGATSSAVLNFTSLFLFFFPPVFEHKQFILWCYIDFVNISQWWECIRHFLLFYIHVFPFLYVIYQLVSVFFNIGETLAKINISDISLTGTGMDM